MRRPILIAGPTASGKSALALRLAERHGGVIVNADSMQVYRELRILTARPSPEDEARVPHRLYGHVPAAEACSVARWLDDVRVVLGDIESERRRAIIVGGTGLYFKALTEGLSPIPDIAPAIRARWREAARQGAAALHRELARRDPVMAARLAPADRQRVTRALEVIETTGRSLAEWQAQPGRPLVSEGRAVCLLVVLPRAALHSRTDRRFDLMMAAGAVEEVRGLMALALDRSLPALRALGVGPLANHLSGRIDRATAVAQAKLETRQYVKRQLTWLNRHMITWRIVKVKENGKYDGDFDQLIDD
jgi:tRNA dimethylallyltransferase